MDAKERAILNEQLLLLSNSVDGKKIESFLLTAESTKLFANRASEAIKQARNDALEESAMVVEKYRYDLERMKTIATKISTEIRALKEK